MKKIKNFKIKTFLGVVIVGLTTLLSSCVQGDLSELYDEELVWSNMMPRTKSGDDIQWGGGASSSLQFQNISITEEGYCALKAIMKATSKSETQVKNAMVRELYGSNPPTANVDLYYYPTEMIASVINSLTGKNTSRRSVSGLLSGSNNASTLNTIIPKNSVIFAAGVNITDEDGESYTEYHAMNFKNATNNNGTIVIHFSSNDSSKTLQQVSTVIY